MQQFLGRATWRVLMLSLLLLLPGLFVPSGLRAAAASDATASARESAAAAGDSEAAAALQEKADDAGASSAELAAAAEASSEASSVPRTRRPVRTARGDGSGSPRRRSPEPSEAGGYSSSDEDYVEGGAEELVELMNTLRERRSKALNKMRKSVKHLSYLNTDLLLGAFVTALVVLYALKVRTRRYTFDSCRCSGIDSQDVTAGALVFSHTLLPQK
ncbi:hypothetical protein Emag_003555 [Eimeria magna]